MDALFEAIENDNIDFINETELGLDIINSINTSLINGYPSKYMGFTPLTYAINENKVEIIIALLAKGADVNLEDAIGNLPLLLAINKKKSKIVIALLEKEGIDVNKANSRGERALDIAKKNAILIKILVGKGASVNYITNRGSTLLIDAIESNDKSKIQLLLEIGADINQQNREGKTPLDIALAQTPRDLGLISYLQSKGARKAAGKKIKLPTSIKGSPMNLVTHISNVVLLKKAREKWDKEGIVCDTTGFYQHHVECWNDSIQMLFCNMDIAKEIVQEYLITNESIDTLDDLYLRGYLLSMRNRFVRHYLNELGDEICHVKGRNAIASAFFGKEIVKSAGKINYGKNISETYLLNLKGNVIEQSYDLINILISHFKLTPYIQAKLNGEINDSTIGLFISHKPLLIKSSVNHAICWYKHCGKEYIFNNEYGVYPFMYLNLLNVQYDVEKKYGFKMQLIYYNLQIRKEDEKPYTITSFPILVDFRYDKFVTYTPDEESKIIVLDKTGTVYKTIHNKTTYTIDLSTTQGLVENSGKYILFNRTINPIKIKESRTSRNFFGRKENISKIVKRLEEGLKGEEADDETNLSGYDFVMIDIGGVGAAGGGRVPSWILHGKPSDPPPGWNLKGIHIESGRFFNELAEEIGAASAAPAPAPAPAPAAPASPAPAPAPDPAPAPAPAAPASPAPANASAPAPANTRKRRRGNNNNSTHKEAAAPEAAAPEAAAPGGLMNEEGERPNVPEEGSTPETKRVREKGPKKGGRRSTRKHRRQIRKRRTYRKH